MQTIDGHEHLQYLKSKIRDIPDYPKPGILFKDLTPLLSDPRGLTLSVEKIVEPFHDRGIETVVGIEARGFIFGAAIASRLNAGFVPVRKPGKLPYKTKEVSYSLEYGTDSLQIHEDAVREGQKCLLIDDLLATGGTMAACAELVRSLGGDVEGYGFLVELGFLNGREKINSGGEIHSVITY